MWLFLQYLQAQGRSESLIFKTADLILLQAPKIATNHQIQSDRGNGVLD